MRIPSLLAEHFSHAGTDEKYCSFRTAQTQNGRRHEAVVPRSQMLEVDEMHNGFDVVHKEKLRWSRLCNASGRILRRAANHARHVCSLSTAVKKVGPLFRPMCEFAKVVFRENEGSPRMCGRRRRLSESFLACS